MGRLVRSRWLLVGIIGLGVVVRVGVMWRSGWRIEYDEAMVALMSRHILAGELPVFLAAQPTLGVLEAYVLAGLFAVGGQEPYVLRILSLLYVTGYLAALAWAAHLAYGRRVSHLATLIAALGSLYLFAVGTKVWAGTMGTLTLGTLLPCLMTITLDNTIRQPQQLRRFALLGLTAGVMFWTALLSAYYLLPAGIVGLVWLVRDHTPLRQKLFGVLVAGIGFGVGSLPFWWYNAANGWITFQIAFGGDRSTSAELQAVAQHFITDLIPRLASGSPEWGGIGASARRLAGVLFGIGWVGLTVGLAARHKQPHARTRWLLWGIGISVPLIYLTSGYARNALNPFGVDATGRYVLMLHSVVPIGLAVMAVELADRRQIGVRLIGMGLITTVLTLSLVGLALVNPVRLFDSPYYNRLPDDLTPLIDYLNDQNIRYVWTDVGIAHPLIFETQEQIIAADYWDAEIAGGLVRFPRYFNAVLDAVERGEQVAYVLPVLPDQNTPPIVAALHEANIDYSEQRIGNLVVYQPTAPIHPEQIAAGLGYQY